MRGSVGVCPVASIHPAAASSANSPQGPMLWDVSGQDRGARAPAHPPTSSSCLCPTVRKVKCPPGLAVSGDERLWCELTPGLGREAAHRLCTTVSVLGSIMPPGSCSDATSGGTNMAHMGSGPCSVQPAPLLAPPGREVSACTSQVRHTPPSPPVLSP